MKTGSLNEENTDWEQGLSAQDIRLRLHEES